MGLQEAIEVAVDRDWFDFVTLIVTTVAAVATVAAVWVAVAVASRDSRERRRLQATMVSAWRAGMDTRVRYSTQNTVIVQNASTSAIYDVLISWAGSWGNVKPDVAQYAPTVRLSNVPPGDWYLEVPGNPGAAMDVRISVLMEFADGAGVRWMRTADGELRQIQSSAWLRKEAREANKPVDTITRISRPIGI
jgi:hypothetical protein